MYTVVSQSCI